MDEPGIQHEPRGYALREVVAMAGPIILGIVSHTIMQFIDTAMVARLGTNALAAIGSAGVWSFTAGCLIFGTVGCVSTFVGQSYGRENYADCARYAWHGCYLALAAGVLAVACWPLSGPFFGLMGHAEEVTRLELLYFRIRLFSYLPVAWMTALASFFPAVGRPWIPMYSTVAVNVINFVLNLALIFGYWGFPRWGIAGAAAATSIATAFQAVILHAVFLSRPFHHRFGTRTTWRFDPARLRELLRIGLPSGITVLMDVANWGIFTSFIIGHFGPVQLAAHNAVIGFLHLSFMPAVGLSQGVTALVGQYIGRGDPERAAHRTYIATRIAMGYMAALGLIFALAGPTLIRWFFSDDPGVIALGHKLLLLSAAFQAFDAVNIIMVGALRGAGDTRWMAWVTFIGTYLMFLPTALFLAVYLEGGAVGAWAGATLFIIGLSGILFARFRGGTWRTLRIFETDLSR